MMCVICEALSQRWEGELVENADFPAPIRNYSIRIFLSEAHDSSLCVHVCITGCVEQVIYLHSLNRGVYTAVPFQAQFSIGLDTAPLR